MLAFFLDVYDVLLNYICFFFANTIELVVNNSAKSIECLKLAFVPQINHVTSTILLYYGNAGILASIVFV